MMGCHFQEQPCRPSLCLRACHQSAGVREGGRPGAYIVCGGATSACCPHRAWDHAVHLEVARARAALTGRCHCCGRRHRLLIEALRCEVRHSIDRAFASGAGWEEEGCTDRLLEDRLPEPLRRQAWKLVREKVIERDGWRCQDCGKDLRAVPAWLTEVHHIVPRSRSGSDHPRNLKTLCTMCHRRYTDGMLMGAAPARQGPCVSMEDFERSYWSEERAIRHQNPPQ